MQKKDIFKNVPKKKKCGLVAINHLLKELIEVCLKYFYIHLVCNIETCDWPLSLKS